MLTKLPQSESSVLYAFGTEATFRWNLKPGRLKLDWSTFIVAKFLKNEMKKCSQNLPKASLQCSMPLAQKTLLAGICSLED